MHAILETEEKQGLFRKYRDFYFSANIGFLINSNQNRFALFVIKVDIQIKGPYQFVYLHSSMEGNKNI